ncbi:MULTISPECIES: Scr1 family TA system antitoxin-like transcriptional regulator [Micromonospora]|uniref:Scr1 family TA system antitoxin-like transcriptional regulator n=1 Tax=Micromonospora TaxID=1873 RepID=UPI001EF9484C|nr:MULTISPECIES: Scr1 family TA system antitoxin-like transcriptional regulator [Micromonospora]
MFGAFSGPAAPTLRCLRTATRRLVWRTRCCGWRWRRRGRRSSRSPTLEQVQVRVIPADGPWHTGLAGPFMLARLPDGAELTYVDGQLRGEIVSDPLDVANPGRRWERHR